jgi:hypothetical protein
MTRRSLFLLASAGVLVLGATGCGGPKPVPVKGSVTLDGQLVDNAQVLFTPVEGNKVASGVTKEDGTFELTTEKPGDGAVPGDYKVTVTYTDPVGVTGPSGNTQQAMMGAMKSAQEAKRKRQKFYIPPVYTTVGSTPIQQKVPVDGPVNIELKSR